MNSDSSGRKSSCRPGCLGPPRKFVGFAYRVPLGRSGPRTTSDDDDDEQHVIAGTRREAHHLGCTRARLDRVHHPWRPSDGRHNYLSYAGQVMTADMRNLRRVSQRIVPRGAAIMLAKPLRDVHLRRMGKQLD